MKVIEEITRYLYKKYFVQFQYKIDASIKGASTTTYCSIPFLTAVKHFIV
jgi:hypothetical protein